MNPMLQVGDTFIRISKYGHVFGEVKDISYKIIKSIDLKCSYIQPVITSTNGIKYDMDNTATYHKVTKQFNEEELSKLKELVGKMKDNESFINFQQVKDYHNTKRQIDNL